MIDFSTYFQVGDTVAWEWREVVFGRTVRYGTRHGRILSVGRKLARVRDQYGTHRVALDRLRSRQAYDRQREETR